MTQKEPKSGQQGMCQSVQKVGKPVLLLVISAHALCFQYRQHGGNHKGCPYEGTATLALQ
jgi:hypothetical protein